jgi:serine/threonine-protein kinase
MGGPELDTVHRPAQGSSPGPLGGTDTPSRPTLIPGTGLNPDRVFGPYYLLDKLATGGMGEVFAAVAFGAEGFKRIFVVKRLRPELNENPELIHQFINEARLGAALVHSNIIPIFDFGKVSEHYYLAEEYILGRNLELLVARNLESQRRTLSMELTLHVVHETLKALAYAHSRTDESGAPMGLVHRDISPSNIMISSRGEVKLLDFGIAKHAGRASATNQTRHGVVKGNMTYMAPEQARGLPVDARTDLFSLGLVLYRCIAGRPLYQGTELHHLLLKAAEGPGEEEWERIQALPEPAAHLLSKALQPDPAMRFGSAEEFAAAIPHPARSAAANLASTVQVLFAEEMRREQQQINMAISSATRRVASAS